MPLIHRFIVTSHTSGDDKDRGNGVNVQIVGPNDVLYLNLDNYGRGLVYRDGDDNGWDRPAMKAFNPDDSKHTVLRVAMTGDDGDWKAAFSVRGITDDGQDIVLMTRSPVRKYDSGDNDQYEFRFTYG
jgi:hypothetical protein